MLKPNITLAQMPFVRILLPLVFGIFLEYTFHFFGNMGIVAMMLILIGWLVMEYGKIKIPLHIKKLISGLVSFVVFFLLGAYSVFYTLGLKPLGEFRNDEVMYEALVYSQPVQKTNGVVAELRLRYISDTIRPQGDIVVLAIFDSISIQAIQYGDVLLVQAKIVAMKSNNNPEQFDYAKYLVRNGIYFQTHIAEGYFAKIDSGGGNPIIRFSYQLQKLLINQYIAAGFEGDEFAVLSALTLGYKSQIDEETKLAFSATGTTHVLAVSGIHVGLIYMVLMFAMQWIDHKSAKIRIIKLTIIISNLWLFALISGMSPSVLRAALMFSLFTIGTFYNRKLNMYNILAGSAVLLLLIKPLMLFDIGFQLSYIAVFSIVALQQPIQNLLKIENKWMNSLWSLTSVTLAAQLGTTPLTMYYFHQFPVYFLVSNLILVPLSSLILYSAIVIVVVSFSSTLMTWVAWIVMLQLKLMTWFAKWIASWPESTVQEIYFSAPDLIFLYVLLIVGIIWLVEKKFNYLRSLLALSALIFMFKFAVSIFHSTSSELLVYNTNKGMALAFSEGNRMLLLTDSAATLQKDKLFSHIHQYTAERYVHQIDTGRVEYFFQNFQEAYPEVPVFQVNNKKVAVILSQDWLEYKSENKIKADVLVVASNQITDFNAVLQLFDVGKVVLCANLIPGKMQRFASVCRNMKIPYHNVRGEGFYRFTF